MVEAMPAHVRWSLDVEIPSIAAERVLACGMGGSGIAGDYASRLTASFGRELSVHKDYGVPAWAYRARPLVVVTSYSGNTEEAVSSFLAANEGGLDIVAVTTGGELARLAKEAEVPVVKLVGGYQPRAAFGMCFGVLIRLVAAAGLLPNLSTELESAAGLLERTLTEGQKTVEQIVHHIGDRSVSIVAAEPMGAVAYRWKTQFNENANRFATASLVPEMTHNELVALHAGTAPPTILLRSAAEPAAVAQRFRLLGEMAPTPLLTVEARGDNDVERMLYLTLIGDMATVAAARKAGVDPLEVAALEEFKTRLRER